VVHLGPIYPRSYRALNAWNRVWRLVSGREYAFKHSMPMARSWKRAVEQVLRSHPVDVVFAPAGSGLIGLAEIGVPVVYASDATFDLMLDYHPNFCDLTRGTRRSGDHLESRAIRRADVLTYPTEWAASSARTRYGADPAKVHVIPWGANLDSPPDAALLERPRRRDRCRLLLVGANWHHKGVDLAVDALRLLRQWGLPAQMTIVGTEPPRPHDQAGLTVIPFLDKHDPEQYRQLCELYLDADFFVLPTRNECYGIVFCEASAFGLPIVACDTGGVGGVVRPGTNGVLVPHGSGGDAYARAIRDLWDDAEVHAALRRSCRREFEERLNWDAWGRRMAEILRVAR